MPRPVAEKLATPDAPSAGPVLGAERIDSIDVLRGFAVLGILVMNIQSFAMNDAAYFNPTVFGTLEGGDYWVWALSHVLADQKFMTIFSLLFGAGIVLMASRGESAGLKAKGLHYRRMAYLLLFGLLHAYFVWHGDILVLYALCGLWVYLLRRKSPRVLIPLGVLVIAVASGLSLLFGWSMPYWPPEQVAEFTNEVWRPPPEKLAEEVATFQGGYAIHLAARAKKSLFWQTFIFSIWGVWRAGGLMLVGMGLYKLGVFSAARSAAFYAAMVAAALFVGIPAVVFGVRQNFAAGWDVGYSFFVGIQFNYWASLLVSGGWIGAVMLLCKSGRIAWLRRSLAAVGRMAFTNYLAQSLICTTIFYGHGFGRFGEIDRWGQILIVFGVWIIQMIVSPLWLRYFRFGPFEWLWRSLSYRMRPAFRFAVSP